MSALVEIEPHRARSLEFREDDKVIRVHLAINSEQQLDRVELDENPEAVTVTPGWDGSRMLAIFTTGRC